MERVTSLIARGKYSYAIPLQKDELKALGIVKPEQQQIQLSIMDAKVSPLLLVRPVNKSVDQSFADMLNAFFDQHPEIADRARYLKQFGNKMKEN